MKLKLSMMVSVIGLTASLALGAPAVAQDTGPKPIRFTTTEAFDPRSIAPYKGDNSDIYAYIRANKEAHLENLRRWVRQKSISAQNDGIQEMAALLRDDLKALGFKEAEVVPTGGHPGVWGYYDAGAKKTLVIYMMYDVQPIEPTGWKVPPFEGALVENELGRVLMGRGASNQKGPERVFLNAVESILKVRKKLPVNLIVLAEGEEEIGSVHYPELVAKYADRLKGAVGVYMPDRLQSPTGAMSMRIGGKGILSFELVSEGNDERGPTTAEIHSSYKSIVDSPPWRLVQALASMTSPDGNTIRIKGWYDKVRQPTIEEQKLTNGTMPGWVAQDPANRKLFSVKRWINNMSAEDALKQYLFSTTLNIQGLTSGYSGPGSKTILPHRAVAKLETRLVPDQMPEEALRLVRQHLDANGYSDIKIVSHGGYPPAQASVEETIVKAAIATLNKHGLTPDVPPRSGGSAPYHAFAAVNLPMIGIGIGHGANSHAPNEYFLIDPKPGSKIAGLEEAEGFWVDLLHAIAETR